MKKRLLMSLCALLLTFVSTSLFCINFHHETPIITQESKEIATKPEVWLTVFVHGIMSIKPHLNAGNFLRVMRDDIENSVYAQTVDIMRHDDYFNLNQAMQNYGLRKVDMFDVRKGHATNGIARIYEEVDKMQHPGRINHYYTFGWSGLMSPSIRYKDAKKFFEQLVLELSQYWQEGIYPKLRLIGYSHGGNVCLNLAAIRQDRYPLSNLLIDELILLGTPVQTETDYLVCDQIFKKIYHLYSEADRIQRIDFFSFNRLFSRRKFQNRHNFKLPGNLAQIQIKLTRMSKTKRRNKKRRMELAQDYNNPAIVSGNSKLLRDASPGHIELWFFGWSPNHYRTDFVFSPLPTLAFVPHIINEIQQAKDQLHNPYPFIIDIRPEHETMIIKQRRKRKFAKITPFITKKTVDKLHEIAYSVKPQEYSDTEYIRHINMAFDKAKDLYEDIKPTIVTPEFTRNRRMRKTQRIKSLMTDETSQTAQELATAAVATAQENQTSATAEHASKEILSESFQGQSAPDEDYSGASDVAA